MLGKQKLFVVAKKPNTNKIIVQIIPSNHIDPGHVYPVQKVDEHIPHIGVVHGCNQALQFGSVILLLHQGVSVSGIYTDYTSVNFLSSLY